MFATIVKLESMKMQVPFGNWVTLQQPRWVNWTSLEFDLSDTSSGTIAVQVQLLVGR